MDGIHRTCRKLVDDRIYEYIRYFLQKIKEELYDVQILDHIKLFSTASKGGLCWLKMGRNIVFFLTGQ
jgi:hypothetical protein